MTDADDGNNAEIYEITFRVLIPLSDVLICVFSLPLLTCHGLYADVCGWGG